MSGVLVALAWVVVACFAAFLIGAGCAGFAYNKGPERVRRFGFILAGFALLTGGPAALAVIAGVLWERFA